MTDTTATTVDLDGVTYTIDRAAYAIDSTMTILCGIEGPRGAYAMIVRGHGGGIVAMTASQKTKLARVSRDTLRAVFEPLFPVTAAEQVSIDVYKAAGGGR